MARRDRFGRGGDHSGFNAEGFAAVGFRESKENYSMQHNANDTIDGVSFPYLAQNARVNAAAMAVLALAPPPPAVASNMLGRQPSGYDARLRWTASPGAVGYRIFWRDAWAPDWQHELYVGNVTEFIFKNKNIDDHVFGVAAVGTERPRELDQRLRERSQERSVSGEPLCPISAASIAFRLREVPAARPPCSTR